MKKQPEHKCEELVYSRYGAWPVHNQCENNAKVERDGRRYCGTHDPVRIKEKQDARNKKWTEERKAKQETIRRRDAEVHYCQNLDTEYLEIHVGVVKVYPILEEEK